MASERPVPTGPEAIALLRQFEEGGKLNPEAVDAGILAIRAQTGQAVVATTPEAPEKAPDRALSFTEAADLLRNHGIDLEKERQDNVRRQFRHGRISADNASVYDARFNNVRISKRDVHEVIQALRQGKKFFTVFSTGQETPAEDFDALLTQAGIRTHEFSRVSGFQNPNRAQGSSVTFTPVDLNVPGNMTNQTADQRLLLGAQETGIQYVEPAGWTDIFLMSVDNGLQALNPGMDIGALSEEEYRALRSKMLLDPRMDEYLLDVRTVTQFPGWRNVSGGVLGLCFDPDRVYREVDAHDYHPRDAFGHLGPRRSLGRFLPRGGAAKE